MFFRETDAISGKMAKAHVIMEGRQEELFYAKSIEATIEKSKSDVPILGRTNTPQRAVGWSGTGTMTIYYVTSLFRKLMVDYVKTGRDFYFDLQIMNDDPQSRVGKQTIRLRNCNLDSIMVAKFDATSDDMLDEEMPFTFNDVDLLNQFNPVIGV